MVPVTALWVPILLSAVIVFVVSSIIHMVLPIAQERPPAARPGRRA